MGQDIYSSPIRRYVAVTLTVFRGIQITLADNIINLED
jgi:hypothetical protein